MCGKDVGTATRSIAAKIWHQQITVEKHPEVAPWHPSPFGNVWLNPIIGSHYTAFGMTWQSGGNSLPPSQIVSSAGLVPATLAALRPGRQTMTQSSGDEQYTV